ncbi:hypothetical protein KIN20_021713 [Parelaphostrongylus tenuis]|uniref:Uncharacterized protein n=1 Tax=Parelaphostrongylus tenuis TaxID=148309 RepID=A0AAD5MT34_PARTN|nr:hypothetical protein KIN20_021713 [Parelaphostrongylus tenuis]
MDATTVMDWMTKNEDDWVHHQANRDERVVMEMRDVNHRHLQHCPNGPDLSPKVAQARNFFARYEMTR